jgi:D-alanyl-D-alanine carboxypeptidase/D-alanyl-D-alanine endopeptidase (penicillin-binding protein 7)
MRIKTAGKNATLVLLNARANSVRVLDALSIRRMISGASAEGNIRVISHKRRAAKSGSHRRRTTH